MLMPHGRWCNRPQVTRNGTILGSDDHLSNAFRRAQRVLLPGACTRPGGLPIMDLVQNLGVIISSGVKRPAPDL